MQIAGWYCSAGREVVDRAAVVCLPGDARLAETFARAEIKRTFYGQHNPILAATPERELHIAPQQTAKLKATPRGRMPAH